MDKRVASVEVREWGNLIGGELRTSGELLEVRSPYDNSLVANTFWAPEKDIEEAIQLAQAGFAELAALPTYRRAEILRKMSAGVESRQEELVRMMALAAGKPVVQKPSPRTPICSLILAEIARDAGVPAGAVNVVSCSNQLAERLVADERFKLLTFTGSGDVGWRLKTRAGKKRVLLELGGNAGVIVHSDADLDSAADRCVRGGFSYSGQSCISVQRIFVHRPVLDPFLTAFVDRVRALQLGDPLDEGTDIGPLISPDAVQRVESWVNEAIAGGAKALTGGKRQQTIYYPTVLTGTHAKMQVNCAEVFGPVVTVEPYDSFEKALAEVNDSPYGLQAGVFTRDLKAVFQAFDELKVGGVIVNDVPSFRVDHMPYGGVKDSGLGREGARYAIEEMTERKILVLNLGG